MLKTKFLLVFFILFSIASCSINSETANHRDANTVVISADKPATIQPPPAEVISTTHTHTPKTQVVTKTRKTKPFTVQMNPRQIVSAHNRVRARFHLAPLSWSGILAQYSTQWANHLKNNNGCRMRHRSHSNFGENLFWASPYRWSDGKSDIQNVTSAFVVNEWAKERKYYNYQSNRCQSGQQCGHYTQIVWKDSRKVGCGFSICPDKSQVWVCSYDPPGNWQGQLPY